MPYFAVPVGDEHDALPTFLGVPRAALRAAVFGLTDEQARSHPAASALCLAPASCWIPTKLDKWQ